MLLRVHSDDLRAQEAARLSQKFHRQDQIEVARKLNIKKNQMEIGEQLRVLRCTRQLSSFLGRLRKRGLIMSPPPHEDHCLEPSRIGQSLDSSEG